MDAKERAFIVKELKAAGKSDAEINMILPPAPPTEQGVQNVRGLIPKALNYTGGVGRGAVFGAAQELSGNDLGINLRDVLAGDVPTTNAIMDKAGIPEGSHISDKLPGMYSETGDEWTRFKKGGAMDPSTRDAVGFAGDIALDPMTYASAGFGPLIKKGVQAGGKKAIAAKTADVLLNPVSKGVAKAGEGVYRFGTLPLTLESTAKGVDQDIAGELMKENIWGRTASIRDQAKEVAEKAAYERDLLYRSMPEATVDPLVANEGAKRQLSAMADKLPPAHPARAQSQEAIDYMGLFENGPVDLQTASNYKTQMYKDLGEKAYDPVTKRSMDIFDRTQKTTGAGWKDAIEEAAGPQGPALTELNEKYGAMSAVQKPAVNQIKKELRTKPVTQVDAMAAYLDPLMYGAKQAAKAATATPITTGAGLMMNQAGQVIPESVWRRILLGEVPAQGEQ